MDPSIHLATAEGEAAGQRYALVPPARAPFGLVGSQMGNRAGSSLEFMDHREYQPGDDLRRIDWSAFGRFDRLTVKLYREEVSPHLDLLLDASRSMALDGTAKSRAAVGLCAALCTAAANASFSHAVWYAGQGCHRLDGGHLRPGAWEVPPFDHAATPADAIRQLPPTWRTSGIRILVSDLLFAGDPVPLLGQMAQGAASMTVIQLLARDDAQPPHRGNIRLVDSESGEIREVFVDAAAQQQYRQRLARHQENWLMACRQAGAQMTTVIADDLVQDWDLSALVAIQLLRVA